MEQRVYITLTIKRAAIRSDLNFTNRGRNGVAWDMVMALFTVLEAVSDVKKISLNMLAFAGGARYARRGTLAMVQCEVCMLQRVINCTRLVEMYWMINIGYRQRSWQHRRFVDHGVGVISFHNSISISNKFQWDRSRTSPIRFVGVFEKYETFRAKLIFKLRDVYLISSLPTPPDAA